MPIPKSVPSRRLSTRIPAFDKVLGGGLVPGSVTLFYADRGVGKTSLLLMALDGLRRSRKRAYMVSAEMSGGEIAHFAQSLGLHKAGGAVLSVVFELSLASLAGVQVLMVDSLQAFAKKAGRRERDVFDEIADWSRRKKVATIIVSHDVDNWRIHRSDTAVEMRHLSDLPPSDCRALVVRKNRHGNTPAVGVVEISHQ